MRVASAPGVERSPQRFRFLPRHRIGWVTLLALTAICLVPTWWAKLDDLLPSSRWGDLGLTAVAVALPLTAFFLARESILRRKDQSVLLIMTSAVAAFAVLIGVIFLLALLGQAVFGS
jgi:predicted permease